MPSLVEVEAFIRKVFRFRMQYRDREKNENAN